MCLKYFLIYCSGGDRYYRTWKEILGIKSTVKNWIIWPGDVQANNVPACTWSTLPRWAQDSYDTESHKSFISWALLVQTCCMNSVCDDVVIISGLFYAFDENRDDHIDFKEMACGISACCRGPMTERQKCELNT